MNPRNGYTTEIPNLQYNGYYFLQDIGDYLRGIIPPNIGQRSVRTFQAGMFFFAIRICRIRLCRGGLCLMFRAMDLSLVLLLSCDITSGALKSPSLLLSCSIITLSLYIPPSILIITPKSFYISISTSLHQQ